MDYKDLLTKLDIKLQNIKEETSGDLRNDLLSLIDELQNRLKFLNKETNYTVDSIKPTISYAKSLSIEMPKLSINTIKLPEQPNITIRGEISRNAIDTKYDKLYLNPMDNKFYLVVCGTIIRGELSSILIPGKDQLMKCTPCKKCGTVTNPECKYYHSSDTRNLTIDYLKPPPYHFRHNHEHDKPPVFKNKIPSRSFHCRYFGCSTHIENEIKNLSVDDFRIMKQLLMNIYIYYSAVAHNRPDLIISY